VSPISTREDLEQLLREVECYLSVVELIRADGREPVWRDEAALCEEAAL